MKATELKELSVEDLKAKLAEESKALKSLVLNHAVSPIDNPMVIRFNRRLVARLKTVLKQKEQA
jgi:large subunit ribosomal protein L29